jgi:hypothetical protein
MTTKPPVQKMLQGILQRVKANKTMKGQAVPNHKRRKSKKVAAHNQTLKQQRQLNDRNHHITTNTNSEC